MTSPLARPARRIDPGLVVAISWLAAAAGATALLGPQLGLRGWAWLGAHHLLCLVGCSHELRQAWRRRRAAAPPAGPAARGADTVLR